jgi:hypothetical protein
MPTPSLQVDLVDQAVVSAEEVEGLARKLGMRLYRTCVKENINVTEVRGVLDPPWVVCPACSECHVTQCYQLVHHLQQHAQ